jgi:hypothetical protein
MLTLKNLFLDRKIKELIKFKLMERGWRDEMQEQIKGAANTAIAFGSIIYLADVIPEIHREGRFLHMDRMGTVHRHFTPSSRRH